MKKLIKSMSILSLVFVVICSSIFVNPVKANDEIELRWKETVDENGYPMQILDMTEEELELYQIAQLKKKIEPNNLQRTSGYTYEYQYVDDVFDSGTDATTKVLIGNTLIWGQRDRYEIEKSITFTLKGTYSELEGKVSTTITEKEIYSFDDSCDSCLGLFARIRTAKYKVTKKDKYTGAVISTYYYNTMTGTERSIRKIYNSDSEE